MTFAYCNAKRTIHGTDWVFTVMRRDPGDKVDLDAVTAELLRRINGEPTSVEEADEPDTRGPAIMVVGGVTGGFTFYGPFESIAEAVKHYGKSVYGLCKSPVTIALLEQLESQRLTATLPIPAPAEVQAEVEEQ